MQLGRYTMLKPPIRGQTWEKSHVTLENVPQKHWVMPHLTLGKCLTEHQVLEPMYVEV